MFFNDIFTTIIVSFIISLISIILLLIATILLAIFYQKYNSKKLLTSYILILCFSLFGVSISLPWLFLNRAITQTTNDKAVKYYELALHTSLLPKVKASMYDFISSHYFAVDKNLPLAIENCEKANQLKGDLELSCMLWDMYLINKEYDKALNQLKFTKVPHPQIESMIYLLKGDTKTAIEIISDKINSTPTGWDYAHRGNYYSYAGNSTEAQNDYQKAIELSPKLKDNQRFNEMRSNKNYFFNLMNKNRKEYNLD